MISNVYVASATFNVLPRPLDLEKRAELLSAVIGYVERHGVADLSLRPLAAELGTSSRMLVYYFGTKEELIAQALAAARPDVRELLAEVDSAAALRQAASRMWNEITRGRQRQSMRVLLEVMGLAVVQPGRYRKLATTALRAWVDPISETLQRLGLDRARADRDATLLVSGLRGLCNDLMVTRDRRRVDQAASALVERVLDF